MDIKYSVIIPAYNAENTIERCVDSLLQTSRDDVELILINDGSTDHTERICINYAENNKNIRFFSKNNGGVSSARNAGLENAKGKYITFVDSDDFVKKEYFDVMDKVLLSGADFVLLGRFVYDGQHYVRHSTGIEDQEILTKKKTAELLSKALQSQQLNAPSSKIFKRQIIEKHRIRFDERLPIGEDKVFVVQYIMHAATASIVNHPIYILSTENQDSLSRKKRDNLCDHILLEHKLLFRAVNNSDLGEQARRSYLNAIIYSYYRSAYTVIAELHKLGYSKKRRIKDTKIICQDYNHSIKCKLGNLKCILVSLPIRLYFCRTIDFMLNKKMDKK